MSKSKREVILDFTPLLDVIMLILFFFILLTSVNFQNKTEEIEANAQSTISEAEAEAQSAISEAKAEAQSAISEAKAEAQSTIEIYNEKIEELEEELNALDSAGNTNGEAIDSLYKYKQDLFLRLKLKKEEKSVGEASKKIWNIHVYYDNTEIGIINDINEHSIEKCSNEFLKILSDNKFNKDENLICELIINTSEGGSLESYVYTSEILKRIEKDYKYLFVPQTPIDTDE